MRQSNKYIRVKRRRNQRGSALLIVLVFAAIVAIMLYKEMPIAAFEAQRQKEELLVQRGEEYKRGVKLFVRKIGRFPASIQELESTNRMRFLRHKYVDPLTGKDDWRLIHAGPGGVITDSKVQTANAKKDGNALGQGAVFAGFNNTFTGDATATQEAAAPNAALRQRPAATKNAGSIETDPAGLPVVPPTDPGAGDLDAVMRQPGQGGSGQSPETSASGQTPPENLPGPGGSQNTGSQSGGKLGNGTDPSGNGIGSVAQQLNNVNPRAPELGQQTSAFGSGSTLGSPANLAGNGGNNQIAAAGGVAGVASKALGKSIKTVNDQTKYSLWEFYYDLRKDQSAGMAGALGGGQQNPNGLNSNQNGLGNSAFGQNQPGQSQSAFGSNNSNSAFGSNNSNSAFGSNNSSSGSGGSTSTSGFGGSSSTSGFGGSGSQQSSQPQPQQPPPAQE